jgi:hypothetical protein
MQMWRSRVRRIKPSTGMLSKSKTPRKIRTRAVFMKPFSGVPACLLVSYFAMPSNARDERPNVLLLLTDDQCPDTIASPGNGGVTSRIQKKASFPNLPPGTRPVALA